VYRHATPYLAIHFCLAILLLAAPTVAHCQDSSEPPAQTTAVAQELDGSSPELAAETLADQSQLSSGEASVAPAQDGPEPSGPATQVIETQVIETELAASEDAATGDSTSAAPAGTASTSPVRPGRDSAWLNLQTNTLLGVVLVILGIASLVGRYLRHQPTESVNPALVRRFRQRLNAWWLMCAILVFGLLLQPVGTVVLFGLVSFWALREFITMAPTRRGDHRALFWALIVMTPLQYVLIGVEHAGFRWISDGRPIDFYGLYSIMIPVYASLLVPARIAISGDHKRFLERSAQITFGLLICVYSLSYAAALINLNLTTSDGVAWTGSPAGLLFFLVLISQLSDILQWSWGHLVGKRIIAPDISSRTWEGFAGGTLSTGLIGAVLYWVTPFTFWEAACMSMVIGGMGMFGGMTMSAIKRDRGVNDYGSLVMGHAGVLDRIDTLCFAAPVFYHLTRFFFSA
jgi:phosphatidate cytidylyltransferase